ncbi:MAG: copper chaperone PCu(A)C [Pseudomonadota bacterium]
MLSPVQLRARLLPVVTVFAIIVAAVPVIRAAAPGAMVLRDARALALPEPGAVRVYLSIENQGEADRLLGAQAPGATATLVNPEAPEGAAIPARMRAELGPDGAYVLLTGLEGAMIDGRRIPLSLVFANAGTLEVQAQLQTARPAAESETRDPRQHSPALSGKDANALHLDPSLIAGLDPSLDPNLDHNGLCIVGDSVERIALFLDATPMGDTWQFTAMTQGFVYSDTFVGGPHFPGLGHGHLFLDGLRLGQLFAPEGEIGALPPGTSRLRVTLSRNDHSLYTIGDRPVSATLRIDVP